MLFNINKQRVLNKTMNVIENLSNEATIEERLSIKLSKEIMKDDDVDFIVQGFQRKYGLQDYDVSIRPTIVECSLVIKDYSVYIEGAKVFSSDGVDTLLSKLSEAVITTDKVKVESYIREVKIAVGA